MTMLVLYSLLLIALAYVIGCILGCLARRFFGAKEEPRYVARAEDNRHGRPATVAAGGAVAAAAGVAAVAATSAKAAPAAAKPAAPKAEAKPAAAKKPAAKKPAAKKPATKKPAAAAKPAAAPKAAAKPAVAKSKPAAKKPAAKKAAASSGRVTAADVKASAVEMKIPKAQAAKAAQADANGKRPMVLATPLGGKKDDLKRVKGIGPVNEKNLNSLGIYHFSQVAAWNKKEIDWIGTFQSFPGRIERENWLPQAKLLAAGKDTEFSKRVDKGEVGSSKSKK